MNAIHQGETGLWAKVDTRCGRARVVFYERKKPFYIIQSERLPRLNGGILSHQKRACCLHNLRDEAIEYAKNLPQRITDSIIKDFKEAFFS